ASRIKTRAPGASAEGCVLIESAPFLRSESPGKARRQTIGGVPVRLSHAEFLAASCAPTTSQRLVPRSRSSVPWPGLRRCDCVACVGRPAELRPQGGLAFRSAFGAPQRAQQCDAQRLRLGPLFLSRQ